MAQFKQGRDERLPLYQQVRDEILDNIRAGVWLPDTAIPTETELTKRYDVAIGTVRKAVDTLVAEGLLYRSQGRGTFVKRPTFDDALFRFFRQTALSQQSVPQGNVLANTLAPLPDVAAQALALQAGELAIQLQRTRLLDEQVVLVEEIWLSRMLFAPLEAIAPADFDNLLYPLYERVCGQRVASATETLTIEMASASVASALGIEEKSPVAVIERVAYGYDKTPLEYRVSKGAAQTFRYQIDIS
ncbi:GntR family transcriptional regulator [Marinomonas ostreistagni]|uniref:GntR family transcriptional regulator n=1 Tax=Marinomonas ostreistagni TaxID=359209 RepID=UPI00194E6D19|nr:GntR family transcriptional regulator [Marinomonas ostreistagni]MBM6550371.1 GntR family transcriptional regulator [Marinomonas ostreistagni]